MDTAAPDELLHALRGAGLVLTLTPAGTLSVKPGEHLTDETRALIREHKAELLAALAAEVPQVPQVPLLRGCGSAADVEALEERAAILEHDAGMSRAEAEAAARAQVQRSVHAQPRQPVATRGRAAFEAARAEARQADADAAAWSMAIEPPVTGTGSEARRQRALALLAAEPELLHAVVADAGGDPVLVTVAVRGRATVELAIPSADFEPAAFLALVARRGSAHPQPEENRT